jgi:LEA14-like dessication related protein
MKNRIHKLSFICALAAAVLLSGCSVFKTVKNAERLKFKMGRVEKVTINGVDFSSIRALTDFSPFEILRFTSAAANGRMPFSCVINVIAKNPNDGKGGYARTDVSLVSFPFDALLDDVKILSGNIDKPVFVPGVGEETVIPVVVSGDLFTVYKTQGLGGMLSIAEKLAGFKGRKANLKIVGRPKLSFPLSDYTYPEDVVIYDKDFK